MCTLSMQNVAQTCIAMPILSGRQPFENAIVLQDVVDSAAAIGGHGLQLSPLDIDLTANGSAGSKAASKSSTAKADGAPEADEAVLLTQLRQRLVQGLSQMQQQQQQPLHQQLLTCLKVSVPPPAWLENVQQGRIVVINGRR